MNDLAYYVGLLGNTSRVEAFRKGIEATVRPGDRVLDLGTGVGTYAFFAARAGAGHVWGVEMGRIAGVATRLARANGLEDRVTVVRGRVPGVELPADLDVLIFEDFPVGFMDGRVWDLLSDVYGQLPDGIRTVPRAGRLVVAPVWAEDGWRKGLPPSSGTPAAQGLHWEPLRELARNGPRRVVLLPEHLLGPGVPGALVPLHPLPQPADLRVEGRWVAPEASRLHGLALWFELEVGEGVWLSNEPSPAPEPWGQLFLTLDPPLDVPAGEAVEAAVWREGTQPGRSDWVVWEVRCAGETRGGHEFGGEPLELSDLGLPEGLGE